MMRVKREKGESAGRPGNGNGNGHGAGGRRREDMEAENVDRALVCVTPRPTTEEEEEPSDRRELRSRYRALKSQVNDRKGQLAQAGIDDFKSIVDRAERLHRKVQKPREQITDAELLIDLTSELLSVAKGAQDKGGMSAAEFVGAIVHNYGLPGSVNTDSGPSIDWEALGLEACAILLHCPGMSTMIGPMNVEIKTRKPSGPRIRERPTEKTRPQAVEEADADRPNSETDANMKTMFNILAEHQRVQLDRMVLNRASFAQTIENLFALSFLVKDGRVEFNFDEDGVQFVVPRNAPAHAARAAGEVLNTQFVFRLDFKCWRLMTETVAEGDELMPHRESIETSSSAPAARTPIRKNSRNRARETPAVVTPGESPEDGSAEGHSQRFKRRLLGSFAS